MSQPLIGPDDYLLGQALRAASDTRSLTIGPGNRPEAAGVFAQVFGAQAAVIVADERTFEAAGRDVRESFRRAGHPWEPSILFQPDVKAELSRVEELCAALSDVKAVPVAVGSGTINDLTKLAAHRLGRPYLVVATAASMDGYTAFGASITHRGSKQTFECPAPRAVVADLDVIAGAPEGMNAAGYADLLAKIPAGADWIVADALGVEPIQREPWEMVQGRLHDWVSNPDGVRTGDRGVLRNLVVGLMMTGFAMQASRSSRPASGAEHQFSHLWDMQHHIHEGAVPLHGFKVGIGTLAVLALYETLCERDLARIDVEAAVARWPTLEQAEARIAELFGTGDLASKALEETRAKHPSREALRVQLERLCGVWPALRQRLRDRLFSSGSARKVLRAAGCPVEPEDIGIGRDRLRLSYEHAYYIRRRFTVLDLAQRLGLADELLDRVFGTGEIWGRLRRRLL